MNFSFQCLRHYLELKVDARVYEIPCPDSKCKKGYFQVSEMENLDWFSQDMTNQHKAYRLTIEVVLDANRTWCPEPDCNTICYIKPKLPKCLTRLARKVTCSTCDKKFCSICAQDWHEGLKCGQMTSTGQAGPSSEQNPRAGTSTGQVHFPVKPCPNCQTLIERNRGCHRIVCRVCQHMFCWLCLASLNVSNFELLKANLKLDILLYLLQNDPLIFHYTSGKCKDKYGADNRPFPHIQQIRACFMFLFLLSVPVLVLLAPVALCYGLYVLLNKKHFM